MTRSMRAAGAGKPRDMADPMAGRGSRAGTLFIAVLLVVVLEGALRKWVSNSLTLPLVLLRDLLALYTIWYALRTGALSFRRLPAQVLLLWTGILVLWGFLQLIVNQFSPAIFVIGLRFWLLYFWFGYAAAVSMTLTDYRRSLWVMLALMIAMTPLVVLQQSSPPGAFINTQIDTDVRDIFVVVAGVVRPTGTFSFTLGFTTFLAMAVPALFCYRQAARHAGPGRRMFVVGFIALLIGTILSGSRSAVVFYLGLLGLALLGSLWFSRGVGKVYATMGVILTVSLMAGAAVLFSDALVATQERFENASQAEDVGDRIVAMLAGEPETHSQITWLGTGLGKGSNLASYFESGERSFMLAETESARILLEGGVMGVMFMLLKLAVIAAGLFAAWRVAVRIRSSAPILVWLTLALALMTWSTIGQLTVNAATGLLFAQALLALRYLPVTQAARSRPRPAVAHPPAGWSLERAT
ncbi:hypothetical protein ACFPPF_02675 [Xenophilus aerolatus]|nr:hypothetical protein [Xenophilus aerolatus]